MKKNIEDYAIVYSNMLTPQICKKTIKVYKDHRIALSASILGIISQNSIKLDDGGESINTSYPNFKNDLKKLITHK